MMQKIKFRTTYSDRYAGEYVEPGFSGFSNEVDSVFCRHVDIEFFGWNNGVYMQVSIIDEVNTKGCEINGVTRYSYTYENVIHQVVVYDYPSSYNEQAIRPTYEQILFMRAIYEGGLTGCIAKDIVSKLYTDLIILEPKSEFGKYLPKVKKNHERMIKT